MKSYNYIIIGAGAAGLHLALAILSDPWFQEKHVLIIDKDLKEKNDRTWCFWETGTGKWDQLVLKSWSGAMFHSSARLELDLNPYQYKMLPSLNFYAFAKAELAASGRFDWITTEVKDVFQGEKHVVQTTDGDLFRCDQLFDSRVHPDYYSQSEQSGVLQHFKGWFIETEEDCFNPEQFTMMDFRLRHGQSTSFTYVLPVTERKALVETTFFTKETVEDEVYTGLLREYIHDFITMGSYSVIGEEQGLIPMTNYDFHKHNLPSWTRIGTAGSWIKPSTGYLFKRAERIALITTNNIKNGRRADKGIISKKYRYFDKLFLDVLRHKNEEGMKLFDTLYSKHKLPVILKFLDEKSSILEECRILKSFSNSPLLSAFIRSMWF